MPAKKGKKRAKPDGEARVVGGGYALKHQRNDNLDLARGASKLKANRAELVADRADFEAECEATRAGFTARKEQLDKWEAKITATAAREKRKEEKRAAKVKACMSCRRCWHGPMYAKKVIRKKIAPRMWQGGDEAEGLEEEDEDEGEEEGEEEDEEEEEVGYSDVTVREAVEWTMSRDSEFTYIDVRSAEEHGKLATVRGALCIPAFERKTPKVPPPSSSEGTGDGSDIDSEPIPVYEAEYDYEDVEWKFMPDFVERMKDQFELSAKLLIGCKTNRSAEACRLLVDAGFTEIYNVESQIFMRTRAPQVWE